MLRQVKRLVFRGREMTLRKLMPERAAAAPQTVTVSPAAKSGPAPDLQQRPRVRPGGILVFRKYASTPSTEEETDRTVLAQEIQPSSGLSPGKYRTINSPVWEGKISRAANRWLAVGRLGRLPNRPLLATPDTRPVQRRAANATTQQPEPAALTMAELLDSVNRLPTERELVLQASQSATVNDAAGEQRSFRKEVSGKNLILRSQGSAPAPVSAGNGGSPAAVATARQSTKERAKRSEGNSGSGTPGNVPVSPVRDVTDFKGWEIEFLASKVYTYLQRRLDIERERHGRPGLNPWL